MEESGRSGGFNLGGRGNEKEENTSISVLKTLNERGRGEREFDNGRLRDI